MQVGNPILQKIGKVILTTFFMSPPLAADLGFGIQKGPHKNLANVSSKPELVFVVTWTQ